MISNTYRGWKRRQIVGLQVLISSNGDHGSAVKYDHLGNNKLVRLKVCKMLIYNYMKNVIQCNVKIRRRRYIPLVWYSDNVFADGYSMLNGRWFGTECRRSSEWNERQGEKRNVCF